MALTVNTSTTVIASVPVLGTWNDSFVELGKPTREMPGVSGSPSPVHTRKPHNFL